MPPYYRQDSIQLLQVYPQFTAQFIRENQQQQQQQQQQEPHDDDDDEALMNVAPIVQPQKCPLLAKTIQYHPRRRPLPTIPEYERKTLETIPEHKVTFESNAQVYEVLHVADYSQEEIENTWYSEDENFHMRLDAREAIRWRKIDEMRGLESETPAGYQEQHAVRLNSLYFVLAEQGRQRNIGVRDEMALATMYSHVTYESKQTALKLAEQDAAAAEEYALEVPEDRDSAPFACHFLFDISQWFAPPKNALLTPA